MKGVDAMLNSVDKFAEATEKVLEVAPKLYDDVIQPSAQESGKLLGRIPRVINAVLAPLDIWILNKEYNIEETKKLLAKKLENVSTEKIVPPEPYVAVPALQAISYSMNNIELRNMYANLLANSMNVDEKDNVHPSFVEIIKQLSPFDANLLKLFSIMGQSTKPSYPIIKLRSQISKEDSSGIDRVYHILSPSFGISINNYIQYSISIDNLIRLHLVKADYDRSFVDKTYYNDILNSDLVTKLNQTLPIAPNYTYVNDKEGVLTITDLGQAFINICVS
ncbi:DUF4393 domain-containing protein [Hathewaya massiliensis]|uniref:DUF4393 domain-containing protein n=1 Tax=Hathewaya massiliensis TaxID=1964382 RepID=UPI001159B621|nr:DUF4393 domain-containing protein [Hathewaya massiliensis]